MPGTTRWPTLSVSSAGWVTTRLLLGLKRKSAALSARQGRAPHSAPPHGQ
jgi:hypothetical protein